MSRIKSTPGRDPHLQMRARMRRSAAAINPPGRYATWVAFFARGSGSRGASSDTLFQSVRLGVSSLAHGHAVAPGAFGRIERNVGRAQEGVGVLGVVCKERDAERRGDPAQGSVDVAQ